LDSFVGKCSKTVRGQTSGAVMSSEGYYIGGFTMPFLLMPDANDIY
jgi:hypothetical protein